MYKTLLLILFISLSAYAQDTTKSQVYKDNVVNNKYPMVKPNRPAYPLLAGYLLHQKASEGDPFAEHELGLRYLLGIGFKADTAQAVYWIKKAVDTNLPSAQFNYAIMVNDGVGADWNPFIAYKYFKASAESGMPEAQYAFALFFTESFVVNKNLDEAYRWFKKSSLGGFKPADQTLKRLEEFGVHPEEDSSAAQTVIPINTDSRSTSALLTGDMELDFYEFALDTISSDESSEEIKNLLNRDKEKLKRHLGVEAIDSTKKDADTTGLGILLAAAEYGSPEALLLLGRMYETGTGVKKDSIEAAASYLRAYRLGAFKSAEMLVKMIQNEKFHKTLQRQVDKNDSKAIYVMAAITALGLDYRITQEQVFEFMEKATSMNYLPAIIEMGLIYYNGEIVDKDIDKAIDYWEKAIELGSKEAEVRMALLVVLNSESKDEQRKAVRKLEKISDSGSVLAQAALGLCYETGSGVKKSKPKAAKYYRQAMYRGSEAAYNRLKRMYDELRPENDEFVIYAK